MCCSYPLEGFRARDRVGGGTDQHDVVSVNLFEDVYVATHFCIQLIDHSSEGILQLYSLGSRVEVDVLNISRNRD